MLIDGFAAAVWRLRQWARSVTLTVEPFGKIPANRREEVAGEGVRLLAFAAPGAAARDIRFEPPG